MKIDLTLILAFVVILVLGFLTAEQKEKVLQTVDTASEKVISQLEDVQTKLEDIALQAEYGTSDRNEFRGGTPDPFAFKGTSNTPGYWEENRKAAAEYDRMIQGALIRAVPKELRR